MQVSYHGCSVTTRTRTHAITVLVLAFSLFLSSIPAVAGATLTPRWLLYSYNQSGAGLFPTSAAPLPGGLAAFPFPTNRWAALLLTGDLAGSYTGKTLSAGVGITASSNAVLRYLGQPDACGAPASVRLYFGTRSYSPTIATPFTEADFWWSRAGVVTLAALQSHDGLISSTLDPALWSDALGHLASSSPSLTQRFFAAAQHVRYLGLSLGGGCYFDNGIQLVSGSGSAVFRLSSFQSS